MKSRHLLALSLSVLVGTGAALFFTAAAPGLTVANNPEWKTRVEKSPRHLEWVTLKHDGREVGAYVGYPERKDKATTVLVIHEIFGHSDWVKALVDDIAAAGYIAVAPDLLWGTGAKGGGTSELTSQEISQKINQLPADQKTADLNAAVDYITKLPGANGRIVVAGFCWGGGESFRFATNNKAIKAALVFYGSAPNAADAIARITAPIYGFYAENDMRINGGIPAATEAMKAASKTYEPVIYAGAGHGFMRAGDDQPPAATASDQAKTAYAANKKAHEDGWKRWMDIMKKVTDAPATPAATAPATPKP
ncbi:MAG: dienelactone hydrolase family protein [Verrucomicrobiota bacterium]